MSASLARSLFVMRPASAALLLATSGPALTTGCTFTTLRGSAIEQAATGDDEPSAGIEPGWSIPPGERIESSLELVGMSAGVFISEALPRCRVAEQVLQPLRTESRSTGLLGALAHFESESTTWIDAETGLPLYKRAEVQQGSQHKVYLTDFRGDGYHTTYTREVDGETKTTAKRRALPAEERAHDLISMFMALRRWEPEPQSKRHSYVVMGTRVWRGDYVHLGEQTLYDPAGDRQALHIEGIARKLSDDLGPTDREPRSLSMWISNDDRRVPLRAVAQDSGFAIRMELRDFRAGSRASAEPKPCEGIPAAVSNTRLE